MKLRFSLADKISITIIAVGLLSLMLVYYISGSYRQFAYQHHSDAIQQLTYLKVNDLIEDLETNSLDLALAIEHENDFKQDFRYKHLKDLNRQLDNQFYQYFVTAGILKLLKLYILDTDFTLVGMSSEGLKTDPDGQLICPHLSQSAQSRRGSEKLQTLSQRCLYKNHPVFAVIVPFGGLSPKGYIQVITDLSYSLRGIEDSLGMPLQMTNISGQEIYHSDDWPQTEDNSDYLSVKLPITDDVGQPVMFVAVRPDMSAFNKEVTEHRDWVIALAFVSTALTVFIVLLILQRSTIPPLAKIHDVLEKIHLHSKSSDADSRLLFEQLLEQIIRVRQKFETSFSVMILDLTHFKQVNSEFGQDIGDKLLLDVEQRLSTILRESDLISWVGTDTPGHKLLPTDSKTNYRATIARLGGDEFGLLLPSAQNEEQATAVALRIVETLNEPFAIEQHDIDIRCKIGISIYPQHGEDEKLLIRNADKAMYMARNHRIPVYVFDSEPGTSETSDT